VLNSYLIGLDRDGSLRPRERDAGTVTGVGGVTFGCCRSGGELRAMGARQAPASDRGAFVIVSRGETLIAPDHLDAANADPVAAHAV
jgi:hypothetical protein